MPEQSRENQGSREGEVLTFNQPFNATSVTRKNSIPEVIDSDMEIVNGVLLGMVNALTQVRTPMSACKIAQATIDIVVKRRQLLLMPCNASENKKSPDSSYEPID